MKLCGYASRYCIEDEDGEVVGSVTIKSTFMPYV